MTVFHEHYPFDLSLAPEEVKRAEFAKMLGTPEVVLAGVLDAGLPDLHDAVCRFNNARARAAAGTRARNWLRLKIVIWRGSWCLRASLQVNKRRISGGPRGPDLLGSVPALLHPELLRVHAISLLVRQITPPSVGAMSAMRGMAMSDFTGVMNTIVPHGQGGYGMAAEAEYAANLETKRRLEVAMGLEQATGEIVLSRPYYPWRRAPLDLPKPHPFGETYPPQRGGKAARKMQRRSRR